MSAYKQAGISLNKALALSAKALRSALKPEFKAAAEKRGTCEAKVAKFENGEATEAVPLNKA
ncbi:uncharacterized protein PRCAT00003905001 [Priceomyces carsonii]|uniref:uncharacterized protein n=1 Tax=Priceomyces carsonii TaxID=28549 RepID=UPI002ED9C5FE|nr:unnamed protein product [Priceomyces carsonii]